MKKPTGIYLRWLELIETYQFEIEHRAGVKHGNVDSMSRAPHLPPPTQEEEEESNEFLISLIEELNQNTLSVIQEDAKKQGLVPISNKQIRRAQKDDAAIRKIMLFCRKGIKPTKEERILEGKEFQLMAQDFEHIAHQFDPWHFIKVYIYTEYTY